MYIFTGEGILNVLSDNLEVKSSSGHFRSDDKKHYNDDQNHSPDKIAYSSYCRDILCAIFLSFFLVLQ
jgi:hypothetical protein